ncbi:MAG: DUF4175 family protein [Byssovorax sp.]
MAQEAPAAAIARLQRIWEDEVRPSARRALIALTVGVVFGAAHLARVGSPPARIAAAVSLAAILVALVARTIVIRRRRRDLRGIVRGTIGQADPELGAATIRALSLVDRTQSDDRSGSPALAELHLARLLGRAPAERIAGHAARSGSRWSSAGFALALLCGIVALATPLRIVEGLDVLAAKGGTAPLDLVWIESVEMAVVPPDYLHQSSSALTPFARTSAPRGSTITVRGRPLHEGRALVLTDGKSDEAFVDDGSGALVARWTLGDTTALRVAARFGAVRVTQADEQAVISIPDELPTVRVDSAPRTVRILEEPSVPIHYEAVDDHGLREVDLVLHSGKREERRVLSRPQAGATIDRGGYEIRASDPFFKGTFTPVEVTVEARDNDVVAGPKWGKSAAILIILPQVGEPEALRYQALLKARDAVTDLLAFRLGEKVAASGSTASPAGAAKSTTAEHLAREAEKQAIAVKAVEDALGGTYGGIGLRGRIVPLMRGQLRRLATAFEAEKKGKGALGELHQKLVDETENALLAIDIGVRTQGVRDTRSVAKRLADVADESAEAAALGASGAEAKVPAVARLDAAAEVLSGGATQLLRLGDLGLDLGEIVQNDLRRITRARAANEMQHAEFASRDLAARLREPDPSFSGGGGKGGTESGGPPSPGESGEEASGAAEDAAQAARDLEDLTRDHAAQMDDVEDTLQKAASPEEIAALKEEVKQHAEAIREAVKKLPQQGGDPGSAEGSAAAGRAAAESMAGSLERTELRDAVENGKKASQALKDAKQVGDQPNQFSQEQQAGREAERAREALERELAWTEDALEKLRKASSANAKADLEKASKAEQRLAERARDLGKKGESGDRSLPQDMLDRLSDAEQSMRDAEKALQEGDGDRGSRHQKEAQRLLEMARDQEREPDDSESEGNRDGDGKRQAKRAEIPGKDQHKRPEEFRRRVIEGLGGSADPLLREAVKRYAEGLLK